MKPVELHHIGPGRKERISPQCQDLATGLKKFARLPGHIVGAALHEIVRMFSDPGMIRRHMIGDEIQDQSQAPVEQPLGGRVEGWRQAVERDATAPRLAPTSTTPAASSRRGRRARRVGRRS